MGGGDPQHKAVKIVEGWREEPRKGGSGRSAQSTTSLSMNGLTRARLLTDGRSGGGCIHTNIVLHDHPSGRRAKRDRLPRRTDNRRRATRSIRSKTVLGEVTVVGYAVEEEQDDDDDGGGGADEGKRRSSRKKSDSRAHRKLQ